jgi:Bestrophin, RFP-TM, chloride channel
MWGSQWPVVFPYCLLNVTLMVLLIVLDRKYGYKVVEISNQGHSFIMLVVSFLLVSRVNMALARYNVARDAIETLFRETREIIQNVCVLSYTLKDGGTMVAKEWRHEVGYRALLLLRTTMVIIDYPIHHVAPWNIPELNGIEATDIKNNLICSTTPPSRWIHGKVGNERRTVWEDALRVPIRVEYLLRKSVHANALRLTEAVPIQLELKIFANIDNFMNGYYSMRKFLTTVRINNCFSPPALWPIHSRCPFC